MRMRQCTTLVLLGQGKFNEWTNLDRHGRILRNRESDSVEKGIKVVGNAGSGMKLKALEDGLGIRFDRRPFSRRRIAPRKRSIFSPHAQEKQRQGLNCNLL